VDGLDEEVIGGFQNSVLALKCDGQTLVNQKHAGREVQCEVPLHPNCHRCSPCRSTQSAVPINRSTSVERGRHDGFECARKMGCKMMLVACLQRQLVRVRLWLVVAGCSDMLVDFGWDRSGGLACCSPSSISQSTI
jgi:hypothetical protein